MYVNTCPISLNKFSGYGIIPLLKQKYKPSEMADNITHAVNANHMIIVFMSAANYVKSEKNF